MSLRFILLMRHAKHSRGRLKSRPKGPTPLDDIASSLGELARSSSAIFGSGKSGPSEFSAATPDAVLTDEGRYETLVAAKRLSEFLPEWKEHPKLTKVLYFDSKEEKEASETAAVFCKGYGFPPGSEGMVFLGPKINPCAIEETKTELLKKARDHVPAAETNAAVLVIGHQPAIGWLAEALLRRPVPTTQSEILCIDLDNKALRWCISPADDTVLEALQDKIKSKMALANVLSGFITAGLGVLLAMLADNGKRQNLGVQMPMAFVAAAFFLFAIALYLRTMFSYDALLMPPRFWAESRSGATGRPPWIVERPPSGVHWILYQNMVRVWQCQFMPATFLTLSGLLILCSAVFLATWHMPPDQDWWQTAPFRALSLSLPAIALLSILWTNRTSIGQRFARKLRYRFGPWLGSED